MTDQTNNSKTPDSIVYFVPERENAKWVRIGAAWNHKDGEGSSLSMDFYPSGSQPGRIVLRAYHPEENTEERA
ncbi:MAG: hypothetical protein V7731_01185 [Amphritea sp.]